MTLTPEESGNDLGLLREVDWDFPEETSRQILHGIHPYPAKFISAIPRELISRLYPNDGGIVLDPFCGSGTTLVEAATSGVPSMGIDLHPIATLISRVKTTKLKQAVGIQAHHIVEQVCAGPERYEIPDIPRLDHWFDPQVQKALAGLVHEVNTHSDESTKNALRLAISSIIVRVSRQESDTRYAAIDKNVLHGDVMTLFKRAASRIDEGMYQTYQSMFSKFAESHVMTKDIMKVTAEDIAKPVSLIITSPPYPNAYEYWLYHKYRMYWLGMDPIAVRELEIGARPHYFKKNPHTIDDFRRQMQACFQLFRSVLTTNGKVCFIVGRSVIAGKEIDNSMLLTEAAASSGFRCLTKIQRAIPATRKSFNPQNSTINSEDLLVFGVNR